MDVFKKAELSECRLKSAAGNPTVAMVEAAFRHHGLHWRYVNMEVLPASAGGDYHELGSRFCRDRRLPRASSNPDGVGTHRLHSDSGGRASGAIGADAEKEAGLRVATPTAHFHRIESRFRSVRRNLRLASGASAIHT